MGLDQLLGRSLAVIKDAIGRKEPTELQDRMEVRNTEREDLLERARFSGDQFKGAPYYRIAEPDMNWQWESMIWPLIQDLDFSCVVDLAAGHGRNSEKLRQYADKLIIVDINQECIDYCKQRFGQDKNITYVKNDGLSLGQIEDQSVTLVYSFDSMVHFDSDVIKEYLGEFSRILKVGGKCFCHHSNYTGNPGGKFTQSPHWRNFMSKELFAHYSLKVGLRPIQQKIIDWSESDLDCLSILQKTEAAQTRPKISEV